MKSMQEKEPQGESDTNIVSDGIQVHDHPRAQLPRRGRQIYCKEKSSCTIVYDQSKQWNVDNKYGGKIAGETFNEKNPGPTPDQGQGEIEIHTNRK